MTHEERNPCGLSVAAAEICALVGNLVTNFIFPNVGVGVYTMSVQAAVKADGTIGAGTGTAIGAAAFGLGSVTVESVRLVHDFSF